MIWTSGTELQRAGVLILPDKQPLSTQFLEWERKKKTPGMGVKPISKTFKIPVSPPRSLSQSLAVIILFALSLLPSEERRWGEKVGGMVYLTLICPVVSFREMTCNLGGKGQLFLFSSSESQFRAPRDFFLKLQTISGSATMFLIHSAGRG